LIEENVKYCNVDDRTNTAQLGLEWKLTISLNHNSDGWIHRCICQASMAYPMQTIDGGKVRVPLHTASFELMAGCQIRWQGKVVNVTGPETYAIKEIAVALSYGEIVQGEGSKTRLHFRRNWFPVIKKISN
jgi:hypothetical protein